MDVERITFCDAIFGQLIASLRKERGLEQEVLAERVGISRAALSRIERGDSSTNLATLLHLSKALGFQRASELIDRYERAEGEIMERGIQIVPKEKARGDGAVLALVGIAALAALLAGK